jgi:hypothetical protein
LPKIKSNGRKRRHFVSSPEQGRPPRLCGTSSRAFIGHHSWTQTDKEVLFDRKCKFRALKPWEDGYIKDGIYHDDFIHIALVEV